MNIKESVINGVKWTSSASIIIAVFQILQVSILARYLSSEDFGLMALVMVVIGFSKIFSDFGISNAIIHHQENSIEQLSTLYWLNILIGIFLFLIISLASPFISSFYGEPKLIELLIIFSFSFIIESFGTQFRVLLQKELNFNLIAKIEIISALISLIVAILLAMNNFGVYTLVFASLTSTLISSILFILHGKKISKPKLIFSFINIKSYLNFGLYQTGQSTLNYFNSQFDILLIGKLLGTEALGVYSIVKQLAMRPAQVINPILTRVTFPILAKLQNDLPALKDVYLKTMYYISLINFPIYLMIAILSEPIVLILFGDSWKEAIPLLRILAIYFMFRSIGNPMGSLVMATGKVSLEFWWNVVMFTLFPIAIYIGSYWNIVGIAYSLLFTIVITLIPMWYFIINKLCKATLSEFFSPLIKILAQNLLLVIICSSIFIFNIHLYLQSLSFIFFYITGYLYLNLKKLKESIYD
jgi:O-antigen/teichoic acid export membrane protein